MIVCDTNLLVYLFLPGEHTAAAVRVFEEDPEWAAPILWQSEFRNVLALYLRKRLISRADAIEAFRQAERTVHGRVFEADVEAVLDLVLRSTCSAYDCEFVWLALRLGVPLVTSDSRVLNAFPQTAVSPSRFAPGSPT